MMMADLICPACGSENPLENAFCQDCGAYLAREAHETREEGEDLVPEESPGLSDLFQSAREEELDDPEGPNRDSADAAPSDDLSGEWGDGGAEGIPDWLNRVRQRAREEDDAVGDLVQRMSAQKETLDSERREARHESFEAWIARLRDQARNKASGAPPALGQDVGKAADGENEEIPGWLRRIRADREGLPEVNGAGSPDAVDREKPELPDWLLNLSESAPADAAEGPEVQVTAETPSEQGLDAAEKDAPATPGDADRGDLGMEKPASEETAAAEMAAEQMTEEMAKSEGPQGKADVGKQAAEQEERPPEEAAKSTKAGGITGDALEDLSSQSTQQIFPPPAHPDQAVTQQIKAFGDRSAPDDWYGTIPGKGEHPEPPPDAGREDLMSHPADPQQQKQADLLAALIAAERTPKPTRRRGRPFPRWLVRLVIGLLLILVLGFSLYTGGDNSVPAAALRPAGAALAENLSDLPLAAPVLLIFDYQPGYSGEMAVVAAPVLRELLQGGRPVYLAASTPSGLLFQDRLLDQVLSEIDLAQEDLLLESLGYFPRDGVGAFGMAVNLSAGTVFDPLLSETGESVEAVFLLTDSYEGGRIWVEQISALAPEMSISLLTTAQAGPLLLPYWDSGQVAGMLSGLTDAAGYEALGELPGPAARRWGAYQAGILILAALLTLGLIFGFERAPDSEGRGDL